MKGEVKADMKGEVKKSEGGSEENGSFSTQMGLDWAVLGLDGVRSKPQND